MPLKNARIHLRVTDEEKQSLVEKATLARQSVSQYILSLSENKTIIVVDGADEVTRQLLKIGNNINQIAIVANTSRKNESELPNYYLKRITDYQNEKATDLQLFRRLITASGQNSDAKISNTKIWYQPRATILPLRFQQISLEKLLFSRFSTVQM